MTQTRPSIVDLIREEALDAELAALLWLLIDARVPLVVCGTAPEARRRQVMDSLLTLPSAGGDPSPEPAVIGSTDAWSPTLSARVLALKEGDRFAIIVKADSLGDLLARITAAPSGLSNDEVRALGLVVIVGSDQRIDAAHLLRPVERDGEGHLQRRPPAVLAAHDPSTGALDHFAWGVAPEIADRIDLSERDFDRRLRDRMAVLAAIAAEPAGEDHRRLAEHIAAEPPREAAPERPPARDQWPSSEGQGHVH